jgi:ABC-type transport system substrate-binding protein
MTAAGLRIEMAPAGLPHVLKAAREGKLMMWTLGYSAASGDGDLLAGKSYGPGRGQLNLSRFDIQAYNTLYERQRQLPDGPERERPSFQAKKLLAAYLPYKPHVHLSSGNLVQPWVHGYVKTTIAADF